LRHARARGAWRGLWAGAVILLISILSLAPYLTSSTELVRMRNALLVEGEISDAYWSPATPPDARELQRVTPATKLVDNVRSLEKDAIQEDWARGDAIRRQLLV
jgi:hypothetical protein